MPLCPCQDEPPRPVPLTVTVKLVKYSFVMSAAIALYVRGTPVQTARPGPSTCVQKICGSPSSGCSPTGLKFQCMSIVRPAYDISFLGLTMRCDALGTGVGYPYIECDCIEDLGTCDSNGLIKGNGSPSVVGATGYAQSTTLIGKQGSGVGSTTTPVTMSTTSPRTSTTTIPTTANTVSTSPRPLTTTTTMSPVPASTTSPPPSSSSRSAADGLVGLVPGCKTLGLLCLLAISVPML
jgi:hypothetical protein